MSAEKAVISFLETSLLMNVQGVGPNVFSYSIDRITDDIMPCLLITHESTDSTEASTTENKYKRVNATVTINVVNRTKFWSIKELCDIRERVSQVLEAMATPSGVVDFEEVGTGSFESTVELELPMISQAMNFSFLIKETDY